MRSSDELLHTELNDRLATRAPALSNSHHGRLRSSQRTIPHHQSLQLGLIGIA